MDDVMWFLIATVVATVLIGWLRKRRRRRRVLPPITRPAVAPDMETWTPYATDCLDDLGIPSDRR